MFEIPEIEFAYKKGTNEVGIWGDFCLANKVHNAVRDVRGMMHKAFSDFVLPKTPMCHAYHTTSDIEFWSAHPQSFGSLSSKHGEISGSTSSSIPESDFLLFDYDLHELRTECHLDEVSIRCVEQDSLSPCYNCERLVKG